MSRIGSVLSGGVVSRRCYGVYARAMNARASDAAARTDGAAVAVAAARKDVPWMRDPKTGCWAPENRVDEVDAVELRNRLLNYNLRLPASPVRALPPPEILQYPAASSKPPQPLSSLHRRWKEGRKKANGRSQTNTRIRRLCRSRYAFGEGHLPSWQLRHRPCQVQVQPPGGIHAWSARSGCSCTLAAFKNWMMTPFQ
ncbi:hypothetical protein GUJ93_ZPchr0003g18461 [Zizania palustris]|uniref:Uncharacterized protein n=1 Tax=Zizania palustris TaxID=103762 RepID=A0A8J5RSW0_ZIZPA|nr:hypothetical protein GUJ93_ZPchr0003g18461 [Zizania palustris]